MTQRFKKAYDALCKSFFEGTLAKGTCVACAIGNIVSDALGQEVILPKEFYENSKMMEKVFPWNELRRPRRSFDPPDLRFVPETDLPPQHIQNDAFLTELTGYNNLERCLIEGAFEGNTEISFDQYFTRSEQDILEDQYKGLCATFEVMCKLDGVSENYEERLQKHPKLVCVS